MKIPRPQQIKEIVQCCVTVSGLSEALAQEIAVMDKKERKALVKKHVDKFEERFSAVRGNRAEGVPVTYADLRLLMAACLREALKVLEEPT